jgi:hypothetical protein
MMDKFSKIMIPLGISMVAKNLSIGSYFDTKKEYTK